MKHYIIGFLLAVSLIANIFFYSFYKEDKNKLNELAKTITLEEEVVKTRDDWSKAVFDLFSYQNGLFSEYVTNATLPTKDEVEILKEKRKVMNEKQAIASEKMNERNQHVDGLQYTRDWYKFNKFNE